MTSTTRQVGDLRVDEQFYAFVEEEARPGTGVERNVFWRGFDHLINCHGPANRALLEDRTRIQAAIDEWHGDHDPDDLDGYLHQLAEIGYLHGPGEAFEIDNGTVDPEISEVAGPQLVVPVLNARYAINAANARWGSLYDALYGTDALGDLPSGGPYDPDRGARVIAWTRRFLDDVVPLTGCSHSEIVSYTVDEDGLRAGRADGRAARLAEPGLLMGHIGRSAAPSSIFLRHHGLGIELVIDRTKPVGADDRAGVADVRMESAVTAIMDCEDSVAAVDSADKIAVYRNWLCLMRGDLTAPMSKGGRSFVRALEKDRTITGPGGDQVSVRGRALMLVRNVGLLMTTPLVIDRAGQEAFEGLVDAAVTVLVALHDRRRTDGPRNSACGSVYVVKPKLHGPDEASFVDEVFSEVESMLDLPRYTVKVGLMDEERRTSVNLGECIRALRHRIAFINTGFLDRTGDEIHTSMRAGPVVPKAAMRDQPWINAYELSNVEIGLACGLGGRAQIGKGMWPAPDLMGDMLEQKIAHPLAGASCAWVPSPTAATLHATHYHRVDVAQVQRGIRTHGPAHRRAEMLRVPLARHAFSAAERQREMENNVQGILGYVVRWVDQGIGCSKVPDINDVALMEDRATCRISSQHVANWLRHGLLTTEQIESCLRSMAEIVDRQNEGDPDYVPLTSHPGGPAYQAARDLIFLAEVQPNGYTEPILHARRIEAKRSQTGSARMSGV